MEVGFGYPLLFCFPSQLTRNKKTKRWVYIIEGLFSFVCALIIWFGLPNDPSNAYFLTDEEKWMMSVRNEQRRKYMGSEKFSWEEMRIELRDPKVYFSSVIQFCQDILLYGFSTFLPAVLRSLGYSSLMSNVLTVPVYAWAAIIYIAMAYFADRYSKYAVVCSPRPPSPSIPANDWVCSSSSEATSSV